MENLINDNLLEKLSEEFEIAMFDDYDLINELAVKTLEPWEYYLFCKEGGELDLEYIYDQIEDTYFSSESVTIDIRELAIKAFDLDL